MRFRPWLVPFRQAGGARLAERNQQGAEETRYRVCGPFAPQPERTDSLEGSGLNIFAPPPYSMGCMVPTGFSKLQGCGG